MIISDELLIAYADGELGPEQRSAVEAATALDADLAARLLAHVRLSGAVGAAFAGVAAEAVPERLLRAASSGVTSNVVPISRKPPPGPRWWALSGGLIAAGIALGIFISPALQQGKPPLVGGDMAARGRLAYALDNQLASIPGDDTVRIGITFRSGSGEACRTFQVAQRIGIAGLACHEGTDWSVKMMVPAARDADQSPYRTAASSLPNPVADLAQSMAVGVPMDAKAEALARNRHWAKE